jgi:thiol-disulfide isomerase/thioredoxin
MAARRRFLTLTAAVLVLPAAAALGWALSGAESDPTNPLTPGAYAWGGGELPDVTFTTLDGEPITVEAFRGELVLLNFWATWCPPCLREIPELVRLHEALADRGVVIVGIAAQSGKADAVEEFAGAHAMSYPVWMVDDASLDKYGVVGFPFTFLVDREGRIRMRYVGPQSYERLLTDIEALLGEDGAGARS